MKIKTIVLTFIFCLHLSAASNAYETILNDENIKNGNNYGYAVCVSEDYVIVGAPYDDTGEDNSGAAYIYHREGTNWVKQQTIKASTFVQYEQFGWPVDIDGNTAIIGTNQGKGAAYIFEKASDGWEQKLKLQPDTLDSNARFRHSVSISGNTVVIGAPYNHNYEYGSVYVFVKENNGWVEQKKLDQDAYQGQRFGHSVSIDGDYIAVGKPFAFHLLLVKSWANTP